MAQSARWAEKGKHFQTALRAAAQVLIVRGMRYHIAWRRRPFASVVPRILQCQFASLMFLFSPCLLVRFVRSPANLSILKEETTTACYNRYTEKSPLVGQHIWHRLQSRRTHKSYVHSAIKKASMLRFSTPRKECTPAYLTATIRKTTNRRDIAISSTPHER